MAELAQPSELTYTPWAVLERGGRYSFLESAGQQGTAGLTRAVTQTDPQTERKR